jgi:hypothetical protein
VSTRKSKRDTKRITVDVILTVFGVAAFLTTGATGLHIASAAIFGALVAWHAWTQRALLKAAIKRALSQKKPARPVFQALNAALAIAVVATFVTGFGLGGGHGFFAYLSLALAGGHVALSWRRILMLASGGRLGKRSRRPRQIAVTAPAAS